MTIKYKKSRHKAQPPQFKPSIIVYDEYKIFKLKILLNDLLKQYREQEPSSELRTRICNVADELLEAQLGNRI